jgi:guanylate kinase
MTGLTIIFISEEDFKHKIKQNEFAEWEMVYEGNTMAPRRVSCNAFGMHKKYLCWTLM